MANLFNKKKRREQINQIYDEPVDRTSLDEAIKNLSQFDPESTEEAKKKEEYLQGSYGNRAAQEQFIRDRMNANDWAEAAQTLAGALAKYGAARSGLKSGYDMSGVSSGPGVDYSARNDRLLRELGQQSESGDRAESRTLSRLDSAIESKRRKLEDDVKNARSSYELAEALRRNNLNTGLGVETEDSREQNANNKLAKQDEKNKEREDQTNKKLEVEGIDKQMSSLQNQLKTMEAEQRQAQDAINVYMNPDASDPAKQAAIMKLGGLSPEILDRLEQAKKARPGFWTWGEEANKEAKQASQNILNDIKLPYSDRINEINNDLKQLSTRRQGITGSSNASQKDQSSVQSSKEEAAEKTVTVKRKEDGLTVTVPASDPRVQGWLKSGKYEQVK